MSDNLDQGVWQRRWNPVFGEWVIMASRTGNRPWQGKKSAAADREIPPHDKNCYLCPESTRANGQQNPNYGSVFAFDNDFASFSSEAPEPTLQNDPCVEQASNQGSCRVHCWSPRHDLTLARLGAEKLGDVVSLWAREYTELSALERVQYVLMFENKGEEVGASNPHPHGQAYAMGYLPGKVARVQASMQQWHTQNKISVLQSLLAHPDWQSLFIEENEHFVHLTPWAARFPYETWIVPKRALPHLADLSVEESRALADIFSHASIRYDNLFQRDCPNMTMHYNAPSVPDLQQGWHYFCCMQPPLRDANTLKYLAGFETGAGDIVNPVSPAQAASQLREQTTVHFSELS